MSYSQPPNDYLDVRVPIDIRSDGEHTFRWWETPVYVAADEVKQWQDELGEKFNLEFDILSRDMIENSRSGNPFNDHRCKRCTSHVCHTRNR